MKQRHVVGKAGTKKNENVPLITDLLDAFLQ